MKRYETKPIKKSTGFASDLGRIVYSDKHTRVLRWRIKDKLFALGYNVLPGRFGSRLRLVRRQMIRSMLITIVQSYTIVDESIADNLYEIQLK